MTWNLADAKNRLTEVVNLALSEGPQTITRRNGGSDSNGEKNNELGPESSDFRGGCDRELM